MKYVRQLLFKYLIDGAATVLVLPALARITWGQTLWVAVVAVVALYLVGDLLVLSFAGNAIAVVIDFGLAFLAFLAAPLLAPGAVVGVGAALTAAGAVAIVEILFHQYLLQRNQASVLR